MIFNMLRMLRILLGVISMQNHTLKKMGKCKNKKWNHFACLFVFQMNIQSTKLIMSGRGYL